MSRLKLPSREEILALASKRADICVSIYVDTSPLKLHKEECRIELKNMIAGALATLTDQGHDKRRIALLAEELEDIAGEDDFCEQQANTLVILATPDNARIYRLANNLESRLEIADRFYLKPLLRALTFTQHAYILAVSENMVKVIELYPSSPPEEIRIPDLPKNAQEVLGLKHLTASVRTLDDSGATARKERLGRYARALDEALVPYLRDSEAPVILFAAEPLAPIIRSMSSLNLAEETINGSPDKVPDHEIVDQARPVLDKYYENKLKDLRELFDTRTGEYRTSFDIAEVAKAATYGMVSHLMVDINCTTGGTIDKDGNVTFSEEPESYGLIDEIVKRVLESGGKIIAVRADDMPGDTGAAAILRYPFSSLGV